MQSLVGQLSELGSLFSGVASGDPISAVLLAIGTILTAGSVAFLGYLTLGALFDLIVPDRIGQTRRRGA